MQGFACEQGETYPLRKLIFVENDREEALDDHTAKRPRPIRLRLQVCETALSPGRRSSILLKKNALHAMLTGQACEELRLSYTL